MDSEAGQPLQPATDDALLDRRSIELAEPQITLPHEFAGLMELEIVTPCAEGMALLKGFAEQCPTLYALAERSGFDHLTHPAFKTNPLWLAFAAHYTGCGSCNEV